MRRLRETDEGNAFSKARQDAIDAHEDEFEVDGETYPVEGEKKYAFMEMKRLVRTIIKEYVDDLEEDMLPIPNVSYPIEIEEIIVDPVADMILEPPELQAIDMETPLPPEPAMIADMGVMDPAVSIDIDQVAVDPILDTIENVLGDDLYDEFDDEYDEFDEFDIYPYGHIDDEPESSGAPKGSEYGRMTKGKLFRMGQMAQSLHDRLEDGQDIPEWAKDKVSTAEDRLRSAYDYIDYKIRRLKTAGCSCHEGHVRKFAREYLLR